MFLGLKVNTQEQILKEQLDSERRDDVQRQRRCNVLKLIDRIGAEIIDAEKLPFYNEDLYFNMNKTEDYELLLHKFQAKNSGED